MRLPVPCAPPPRLEVVIEIPRGSFLKRGSRGRVDFISPLPCLYNYGSVEAYIGLEGDLLDALVLGPRLPRSRRVQVWAYAAVGMTDRGLYDDKLVCASDPPSPGQYRRVLAFLQVYARAKGVLNLWRGRPGRNSCDGWVDPFAAIARARPRESEDWQGPTVPF